MRAILGFLRRRARDAGVTDGRGGAVAILQRFGGALNLNVHIHALVVDGVPADQRDRLERIARYALRPPVAQDRLAGTDAGQVRLELRRSWSDGTTHLLFDPEELLERLPCPRCGGRLTLIALDRRSRLTPLCCPVSTPEVRLHHARLALTSA